MVAAIATGALAVLYPVAIWIGLTHLGARALGIGIVVLLLPAMWLRFRRASRADLWAAMRVPLAVLAVVLPTVIFDDPRFVLAMPVVVSLVMLATFGASLFGEHTIIERFARMQLARMAGRSDVSLSPAQVAHCRQATWAWCAFFALNAVIALVLALAAPIAWWAAYTGGVAYALMGLMFAAEYLVRRYRFGPRGAGLHDRLSARSLPPREGP
ncbi:MAG TPA: hypothetical protein VIL20_02975 [Sandaracinaceae bacterium]